MQCIINYRCEPLLHFTYRYNKLPLAPVVLTLTSTQCLTKKRIFFFFLFLLIFTCALVSLRSLCRHGTNALRQHDSHPQTSPLMFRQDLNQNVRLCFMFSSKRSHARLQLKRAKAAQWTQEALFSFHFCFGGFFFVVVVFPHVWKQRSPSRTRCCAWPASYPFFMLLLLWGKTHKWNPVPTKCYIVFLYHILCR